MRRFVFGVCSAVVLMSFIGCGGGTQAPVEPEARAQTPTSDVPSGKEPVLSEEGP
ncbi:MAG: hypothetical protein NXI22_15180 [bacterium]|nr:hypothetical protein [bacterium]